MLILNIVFIQSVKQRKFIVIFKKCLQSYTSKYIVEFKEFGVLEAVEDDKNSKNCSKREQKNKIKAMRHVENGNQFESIHIIPPGFSTRLLRQQICSILA